MDPHDSPTLQRFVKVLEEDDDVLGLTVTTQLELDPTVPDVQEPCSREECVKTALASHPEIVAALMEVIEG